MTIDTKSAVSFGTLKYANIIAGNGNKVVIAGQGDVFGQAIIHSRSVGGALLVSRTKIALNSDSLVKQFSNQDAVKRAIASYGVDADKLLEPGSPEQKKPSQMPGFAEISITNNPSEGGSVTIHNEDTGETAVDFMKVPIGTKIFLEFNQNDGYTWLSYEPQFGDQQRFFVNSNLSIVANWKKNV